MTKIRKLMAIALALAMTTAMFAGCSNEATPTSDTSSSESSSVAETPAEPVKATGVVKEMSMTELVVTLEDGSDVMLKVEGLEGLADIALGDTIEVEYTEGEDGAVAASVKATAKAEEDVESESSTVDEQSSSPDAQTPQNSASENQAPTSGTPAASQPAASQPAQPAAQTQTPAAGNTSSTKDISKMTDKARAKALFYDGSLEIYDWTTPTVKLSAAGNQPFYVDKNNNILAMLYGDQDANDLKAAGYGHYEKVAFGWAKAFNDYRGIETEYVDGGFESGKEVRYVYNADKDTFTKTLVPVGSQSSGNGNSGSNINDGTSSVNTTDRLDEAIRLVNEYRAENGLSELDVDQDLMELASIRADELVDNFSHERPDGTKVGSLGYWEIIASGCTNAEDVLQAWKGSSAHNSILLEESTNKIGVGVRGSRWAMLFSE